MAGKQKIAIIGAGLMGHGIAQVFAVAGHDVAITDPVEAARQAAPGRISRNLAEMGLDPDAVNRISLHADLAEAVAGADVVIEAALENMELKQKLFAQIEAAAPAHAILASNTSVMPITQIMQNIRDKSRALGTHWWNPPFLVPLVEVVRTVDVSDKTVASMMALLASVGKTPVEVKKDVPGFVGNRLQHALWREAISIVEQGICDADMVDMVVKASFGRRLPVLGPLENADMVGADLTLAIHQQVLPYIDSRPAPSPLLEEMVKEGKLGFKSCEGFRTWSAEDQNDLRKKVLDHLMDMDAKDKAAKT
ncbi:3-hydroxyacyl-CoA dehydrogenase family protein [Roseiarcaceae bacterium H3SJ34-1]|uniref:3-hydroxyacyl-CoA dehydrogenase family protein n=1 Tax=Terripilifer ovatus TaxID=3032367 RepID=UPI003AB97965|nr:3-hydroxyacyl-CoA dehydrogenase family protein [Roseiarcaceae bacterium H3SJ34-1]